MYGRAIRRQEFEERMPTIAKLVKLNRTQHHPAIIDAINVIDEFINKAHSNPSFIGHYEVGRLKGIDPEKALVRLAACYSFILDNEPFDFKDGITMALAMQLIRMKRIPTRLDRKGRQVSYYIKPRVRRIIGNFLRRNLERTLILLHQAYKNHLEKEAQREKDSRQPLASI